MDTAAWCCVVLIGNMSVSVHRRPPEEWTAMAADLLAQHIESAIQRAGRCVLALSGGSTPAPIYHLLAAQPLDWTKVYIILADERHLPPENADSNAWLVRECFGDTAAQCVLPDTSFPPTDCAAHYALQVEALLAKGSIDVLVLGMGEDGHIASLFPPLTPAMQGGAIAIHTQTERFTCRDRISLSLAVLCSAKHATVLLRGAEKERVFLAMQADDAAATRWPLKAVLEHVPTDVCIATDEVDAASQ